jgi:hypothetical protein
MTTVIVKYHSQKMLLTVHLEHLFGVLFREFSGELTVTFSQMNDSERKMTSSLAPGLEAIGIEIIHERFWVLEHSDVREGIRRMDLEKSIGSPGIK